MIYGNRVPHTIRMIWRKMFFGHIGDGRLDVFDFLPLAFSLLAGVIIFSQLFPNVADLGSLGGACLNLALSLQRNKIARLMRDI